MEGQLQPSEMWGSYITAQRRSLENEESGFVFDGGVVEGSVGIQMNEKLCPSSNRHVAWFIPF